MPICDWCDNSFDEDEAENIFEREIFGLSFRNISPCLCGECAVQAINDEVDGVYYETCEKCGDTFDLFGGSGGLAGRDLMEHWSPLILCPECALEEIESERELYEEDEEDKELSVWDAALIWASMGKDEDYMFGYTEEELEDAL